MHRRFIVAASIAASLAIAGMPVPAADLWLQPEPFPGAPGETVDVQLMLGDHFEGKALGYQPQRAVLFQRIWKSGRQNLGEEDGGPPAGRFVLQGPGIQLVAYSHHGPTGADDGYYCKAILVVGEVEEGSPLGWSEIGQRLEIVVPRTDPVALRRAGGRLEIQALFEREPLAGATVVAAPRSAPREGLLIATTDELGLATFRLDRPGLWMIRLLHKAPDSRSRATLVLEVGPGGTKR